MKIKVDIKKTEISSFEIEKHDFNYGSLEAIELEAIFNSIPGLYFFHDKDSIYIGESNHP